jgi:hypothetical protein
MNFKFLVASLYCSLVANSNIYGADTAHSCQYYKYSIGFGWNFITTFPTSPLIGSKNSYGGGIPQQIHLLIKHKFNKCINFSLALNSREFGLGDRSRQLGSGETTSINFTCLSIDYIHFKMKSKTQYGIFPSFYFRYSPFNGQRVFYGMANADEGITGTYSLLSPGIGLGFLVERKVASNIFIGACLRYCYYFESPKYHETSDKYILEALGTKPNRRIGALSVYFSVPFGEKSNH